MPPFPSPESISTASGRRLKKRGHYRGTRIPESKSCSSRRGELRWEVENQEVELRANSVFYTLPWQEHGGVEEMQPSCEISYLCLKLARKYQGPVRRLRFHPAFAFTPGEARLISSTLLQSRTQAVPAQRGDRVAGRPFFRTRERTDTFGRGAGPRHSEADPGPPRRAHRRRPEKRNPARRKPSAGCGNSSKSSLSATRNHGHSIP